MILLEGFSFAILLNVLLYVVAAIVGIYVLLKIAVWFLKESQPKTHYANLHSTDPFTVKDIIDISYDLYKKEDVRLSLLNDNNEEVLVIATGEQEVGEYSYPLHTRRFPDGRYKYKLVTADQTSERRIIINNQMAG